LTLYAFAGTAQALIHYKQMLIDENSVRFFAEFILSESAGLRMTAGQF